MDEKKKIDLGIRRVLKERGLEPTRENIAKIILELQTGTYRPPMKKKDK
jgi:hypothetical protein